ncbi:MAG: replicative DNA helicase [Chthonomonas sp.]|nr:replicative DNA helicase [Chthonomonas sp.]
MAAVTRFDDYVPPHSLEAEMCALGAMLLNEKACDDVIGMLKDGDFYSPAHREIFKSIYQLASHSRAVDLVTVKNELQERGLLPNVGGTDYLIQIAESVPSASNAEHYAGIVLDKATLRRLEDAGHQIVQLTHDGEATANEKVDQAEGLIFQVGRQRLGKELQPIRSVAKDFFIQIDEFFETGQAVLGHPSGFFDLDKMTGGFYGGDFTVLAARPSMGKTSLALNFALNVARENKGNVAIFSIEMGAQQLVRRMLSMISRVSMGVLKRDRLPDETYQKLADACESLYTLPIFIDDSSEISPMEMRGKCRRLKQDGGLAMVVVDYLQLMRSSRRAENRVQEVSEIARGLKALAKELEVPVVALSQLSRGVEAREDKRPMLSDIRESGSIEAEADLVMFIYRDSYYKAKEEGAEENFDADRVEESEVIIAKHRNGPTGKVVLGFQPSYARFVNLRKD